MAPVFVPVVDWTFLYRSGLAVNLVVGTLHLEVLDYVIKFGFISKQIRLPFLGFSKTYQLYKKLTDVLERGQQFIFH